MESFVNEEIRRAQSMADAALDDYEKIPHGVGHREERMTLLKLATAFLDRRDYWIGLENIGVTRIKKNE